MIREGRKQKPGAGTPLGGGCLRARTLSHYATRGGEFVYGWKESRHKPRVQGRLFASDASLSNVRAGRVIELADRQNETCAFWSALLRHLTTRKRWEICTKPAAGERLYCTPADDSCLVEQVMVVSCSING